MASTIHDSHLQARTLDWTMGFVWVLLHEGVDRCSIHFSSSEHVRTHTIVQWIRLHASDVMDSGTQTMNNLVPAQSFDS
jgi:hypothetical protein